MSDDKDEDQPCLEAWAIFSHLEGSLDLFVHPALHGTPLHEIVMDEYVAWAEVRAREAGLKQIMPWWAMEYDKVLARLMQARGFVVPTVVGPPAPLFERTLDALPPIPLPDGFTVQGVSNAEDGRRDLSENAHAGLLMDVDLWPLPPHTVAHNDRLAAKALTCPSGILSQRERTTRRDLANERLLPLGRRWPKAG